MAKAKELSAGEIGVYMISIKCPGCHEDHGLAIKQYREGGNPVWAFNGDLDKPTVSPSLLVRTGHYADHSKGDCWCVHNAERKAKGESGSGFECRRCHSFIENGKIRFLDDSTHDLAGKTVELPDWED